MIAFESNGALGFIERLPDYEDRKEELLAGKEHTRLTAVMVGEVRLNSSCGDLGELERWLLPHDLLMLLALATGAEVGAPWIELRDDEGRLVRRFHRRLREARFSRGYRVIDELPFKDDEGRATGMGYLITRALESKELGQSALRTAILHLVRSKYRDQSLDESLAHLCRGLDGLCEHYGVAKQNLMASLEEGQGKAVKEVLAEASRKIREIKDVAMVAGNHGSAAALGTIGGRVSNAANTERKFGLALVDLLQRFGMPDAKIVDEHYTTDPRADGKEHWADVISGYRTDVIHYGYLRLGAGGEGWRDVWAVINHLHDLMARILLQAFDYDGGYQPTPVPSPSVPYPVDWVKTETLAGMLGY